MSTTSSLCSAYIRAVAGCLPNGAITEWLRAEDPCAVIIEEDSCGNILGDPIGSEKFTPDTPPTNCVIRRIVHPANQHVHTNVEWARAEMIACNLKNPASPVIIKYSRHNPAYICLVRTTPSPNQN